MWTLIENTLGNSYWYNPELGVVNVGHGANPPKTSGGYYNLQSLSTLNGDQVKTPELILDLRDHIGRYMTCGCTFEQALDYIQQAFGEQSQYITDQLKKDIQK